jgi:hypothetical protein
VLDVDGRINTDAVVKQFFDIQAALGMTTSGRIGMGKLVDEYDLRPPHDNGVEIHFLEPLVSILDPPARNDLESLEQGFGLFATMRLDNPDHDVVAVLVASSGGFQHRISLAHTGRGTYKDAQLAELACFAAGGFEQSLGRRTMSVSLVCHSWAAC